MREIEVHSTDSFIVGYVPGRNSKRAIIFNAHTDTVPAENIEQWMHHPLSGDVVDGKMYGRGASDMKIAVAAYLAFAEKAVADRSVECDLFFSFVAREETDGLGTRDFLKWFEAKRTKYEEVAVIVGEPTGMELFAVGHKGNIFVKATVQGETGHGSKPDQIKIHSIYEMEKVIAGVLEIEELWKNKYTHPILGMPTIGLTSILAGNAVAPNVFPSTCEATFDIRTTPQLHDVAISELRSSIPDAHFEVLYQPSPCAYTEPDELICTSVGRVSGVGGETVGWASDLCYFTAAGIPGVIYGPGEQNQLHVTDEYAYLDKLDRYIELLGRIVIDYSQKYD